MAAATVTVNSGRVSPFLSLAAVPVTVTYSATAYATATGGLPFDLFAALASAGPQAAPINYKDIIGLVAWEPTTEKFVVGSFLVGTPTSTTLPCTVRLYGTGSANLAAFSEVADAALTGSFSALVLLSRGGAA